VAAYALCSEAGSVLLTRIAPGFTASSDGSWTLPGGGVDFGEDPQDAVLRELREETGLEGEVIELAGVNSVAGRWVDPRDGIDTDFHGIRLLYRVRIVGGTLTDEFDGSTDACRWVPLEELPTVPHVPLVEVGLRMLGVPEE
jgi:ADP-ribose pyrophosphatase YjhB (NUDIX family)